MKKLLPILLLFMCWPYNRVLAQSAENPTEVVYGSGDIDQVPAFPGGESAFDKFFFKSFKMPEQPKKAGEIVLQFTVEKDGSVSEITSIRDFGYAAAQEAIRVLQTGPKWLPGKLNGQPVRCKHRLTIAIDETQNAKNKRQEEYISKRYTRQ